MRPVDASSLEWSCTTGTAPELVAYIETKTLRGRWVRTMSLYDVDRAFEVCKYLQGSAGYFRVVDPTGKILMDEDASDGVEVAL